MVESTNGAATAVIEAVRQELSHFTRRQRDPAVLLRCADIDGYLARASLGRNERWLREVLASKTEKLAAAVRNAKLVSPVADDRSHVTSVMIEVLGNDCSASVG
jgi:hypothetical protein